MPLLSVMSTKGDTLQAIINQRLIDKDLQAAIGYAQVVTCQRVVVDGTQVELPARILHGKGGVGHSVTTSSIVLCLLCVDNDKKSNAIIKLSLAASDNWGLKYSTFDDHFHAHKKAGDLKALESVLKKRSELLEKEANNANAFFVPASLLLPDGTMLKKPSRKRKADGEGVGDGADEEEEGDVAEHSGSDDDN